MSIFDFMKSFFPYFLVFIVFTSCSPSVEPGSEVKLELSDKNFQKIADKRNEAISLKHLYKSKDDYVKGELHIDGKRVKVKARLKGDHVDHLEGNRWSYRVSSDGPNLLNHYKISIQGLKTRGYLAEWVYHQLLKSEDLIYLQYEFRPFSVNDTLAGIYAFESHFDNHLLRMSKRPFGPILKFDETDFWGYGKTGWKGFNDDSTMVRSKILVCNKKWLKENDENESITSFAINLVDNYRKGKNSFRTSFDLEKWATFIALNELSGIDHSLRWHNLRLYYNPESKKIEPIGFDNGTWFEKDKKVFLLDESVELFYKEMFSDKAFVLMIKKELFRLCEKSYLDAFFDAHEDAMDSLVDIIQEEKEDYKYWTNGYYDSQERIKNQIIH